jgi:hypothetical protein
MGRRYHFLFSCLIKKESYHGRGRDYYKFSGRITGREEGDRGKDYFNS